MIYEFYIFALSFKMALYPIVRFVLDLAALSTYLIPSNIVIGCMLGRMMKKHNASVP